MTALTANVARDKKATKLPSYGVMTNLKIYLGAMCKINATGFLAPCSAEAGAVFAGIARSNVDMTGETSGDFEALVETRDSFYVAAAGLTVADIGKKVYAADDNLVQLAAGTNLQLVGKIIEVVSATQCLVQPNPELTK